MSDLKILYLYDALCGWCYGFSPVMHKLYETFQDQIAFDVLSGGMIRGEDAKPIGERADFIRTAYPQVEEVTGVRFGLPFIEGTLADGSALFSSVKPAIALCILKKHQPEAAVPFAHALQNAIYGQGELPEEEALYARLAATFGLESDAFLADMQAPQFMQQAEEEFALVERLGIRGFPTVVLVQGQQGYVLATGWQSFERLQQSVRHFLEKH